MKKLPLLFEDLPSGQNAARRWSRRGLAATIAIFLATRLLVFTAAYCGAFTCFRIEEKIEPPLEYRRAALKTQLADPTSDRSRRFSELMYDFSPLLHWDAGHYRSIVDRGYEYSAAKPNVPQDQNQHNIAFFPLYPLICMILAPLIGTPAAMILVSNASALFAAVILFFWVCRRIDEPTAIFSVACAFCWPPTCFYSYGYTEGITVLLFVAGLALLDSNCFFAAACISALATAARPTAVPLAALIALVYLLRARAALPRRISTAFLLGAIGVTGAAAYAIYLTYRFGSPMVYLANYHDGWVPDSIRPNWYHYLTLAPLRAPLSSLWHCFRDAPTGLTALADPMTWNMPCGLAVLFLSFAGMPRVPRTFRPFLLFGPLIFLDVYISSAGNPFNLSAISRYTMLGVPTFILLAAWCTREWRPGARTALIAAFLLLQASWAYWFGMHEWTG